jgi:hypothetical protein
VVGRLGEALASATCWPAIAATAAPATPTPSTPKPTAGNDWMVEGPHVMILAPDPALLEAVSAAHHGGGTYVMWKGTPYAHVMMPVGERPEQRQAAGR